MIHKNKKNCIEVTISLREVLQNGASVTNVYISNRYEVVSQKRDDLNKSLDSLLKETHGYMDRNKIGV